MPVQATRRIMTRRLIAAALVCALTLALAGCSSGGDAGPSKLISSTSAEQLKADYMQSFGDMQAQMEDPNAPPVELSIKKADKEALIAAAQHWDAATAAAAAITPPADIKAAHRQLVVSMKALAKWNFLIAKAAPNRTQTQALYKKAAASQAAAQYGQALDAIQKAGYPVLDGASGSTANGVASGTADPLSNAGGPGG